MICSTSAQFQSQGSIMTSQACPANVTLMCEKHLSKEISSSDTKICGAIFSVRAAYPANFPSNASQNVGTGTSHMG